MQRRRLTRLTNIFSGTLEDLKAVVAQFFWNWNDCWTPSAIRVTPPIQVGIADRAYILKQLLSIRERRKKKFRVIAKRKSL